MFQFIADVSSIQHALIKFECALWQDGDFAKDTVFLSSANGTDSCDLDAICLDIPLNVHISSHLIER